MNIKKLYEDAAANRDLLELEERMRKIKADHERVLEDIQHLRSHTDLQPEAQPGRADRLETLDNLVSSWNEKFAGKPGATPRTKDQIPGVVP